MANKTITVAKTPRPNKGVDFEFTALAANDTALVPSDERDEQTFIVFKGGTAGATVTLKAGNGVAGCNDLTIPITQSKYTGITVDSSRYKNVSGENKGKLVFTASAAVDIAVVTARV